MRKVKYNAGDVALALRLSGLDSEATSRALTAAKYPKKEIRPALTYAGYKL